MSHIYRDGPADKEWIDLKVGEYVQQNSTDQANSSSEYGRSELRDLVVSHS